MSVVYGKITEEGTGKPIIGVSVVLRNAGGNAVDDDTTDENGAFSLDNAAVSEDGSYLDVFKDGYGAAQFVPEPTMSISLYRLETTAGAPNWVWIVAAISIIVLLYFFVIKKMN